MPKLPVLKVQAVEALMTLDQVVTAVTTHPSRPLAAGVPGTALILS